MPPRETHSRDLDVRVSLMEQTIERMGQDIHQINSSLSKIMWAVGIGVITAAVNWVLKGGLIV